MKWCFRDSDLINTKQCDSEFGCLQSWVSLYMCKTGSPCEPLYICSVCESVQSFAKYREWPNTECDNALFDKENSLTKCTVLWLTFVVPQICYYSQTKVARQKSAPCLTLNWFSSFRGWVVCVNQLYWSVFIQALDVSFALYLRLSWT